MRHIFRKKSLVRTLLKIKMAGQYPWMGYDMRTIRDILANELAVYYRKSFWFQPDRLWNKRVMDGNIGNNQRLMSKNGDYNYASRSRDSTGPDFFLRGFYRTRFISTHLIPPRNLKLMHERISLKSFGFWRRVKIFSNLKTNCHIRGPFSLENVLPNNCWLWNVLL